MKIVICSSLDFMDKIFQSAEALRSRGHTVTIPISAELVFKGESTPEQIKWEKESGEFSKRIIRLDAIRYYFHKIREADAILVINLEKKGVKGYIGGATFLEMGFAHVLGKRIFLLNPVPDMHYKDEIEGMQPVVLNGDLRRIR